LKEAVKSKTEKIFLIGFMGSGKTSFGKKLAIYLEKEFIDLDHEIEKKEKLSINEIFLVKGETYFRNKESQILKTVVEKKDAVFALGGGTVCYNENLAFLKENGILVYLELPIKTILGRLRKDNQNRPLIKDLDSKDFISKISNLFSQREVFYKQADIILDAQISKSKLKRQIADFIENQK